MTRRIRFALFFAGALVWPAFGDDCFCLIDADDTVWFECREQSRPPPAQPLVFCTDAVTREQAQITQLKGLRRLKDGETYCTPCRLSDAVDLGHVIRSGDEEESTAEAPKNEGAASSDTQGSTGKGRP